jgi:hypothetical protein
MKKQHSFLVHIERYNGPFVIEETSAINAVLKLCEQLGMFYMNVKFEVKDLCRTYPDKSRPNHVVWELVK